MDLRSRPYATFFALGIGAFVVANIGFEVFARVWIGLTSLGQAISETLYYLVIQPSGAAMLLAPFLLPDWMAASLARKRTLERGLLLFGISVAVLAALYFEGHVGSEQAMQNRRWTAAALSVGLLPFKSIPLLVLALIGRLLLGRQRLENTI